MFQRLQTYVQMEGHMKLPNPRGGTMLFDDYVLHNIWIKIIPPLNP